MLPKSLLYEKGVCKMLIKLTPGPFEVVTAIAFGRPGTSTSAGLSDLNEEKRHHRLD